MLFGVFSSDIVPYLNKEKSINYFIDQIGFFSDK